MVIAAIIYVYDVGVGAGRRNRRALVSRRAGDINRYSLRSLRPLHVMSFAKEGEKSLREKERKGWYVGWSSGWGRMRAAPLSTTPYWRSPLHSILWNLYDVEAGSIYDRAARSLHTKYPITAAILTLKRELLPLRRWGNKTSNNPTICSRLLPRPGVSASIKSWLMFSYYNHSLMAYI